METILDAIARATRERVERERGAHPLEEVSAQARSLAAEELAVSGGSFAFPFERALKAPGMSFICEIKRASPSKGLIAACDDPVAVARDYERAGASAISCLTEPTWFKGSDDDLEAVASSVRIPVLRKDFVVDEYMVYQAKCRGASAVLLICSILDDGELARCVALAHELGLSALVEAYEPEEVPRALAAGARVVGVNNRDLRTFKVDFGRSVDLRPLVGPDRVFVSESGVGTRSDVERLEAAGVDAALVGETLMRAPDRVLALAELRGSATSSPGRQEVRTRVKLCGMSRESDVEAAIAAGADLCGFVVEFPRSRRSISGERLVELCRHMDEVEANAEGAAHVGRVGVFVDAAPSRVAGLAHAAHLDAVQLHGSEDNAYLARLRALLRAAGSRTAIIQAVVVRGARDVRRAQQSHADLVLLDAGRGQGSAFDWGLVRGLSRPYLLAGGLGPDNVATAVAELRPWGVDMSSSLETHGLKDPAKMKAAVVAVRGAKR